MKGIFKSKKGIFKTENIWGGGLKEWAFKMKEDFDWKKLKQTCSRPIGVFSSILFSSRGLKGEKDIGKGEQTGEGGEGWEGGEEGEEDTVTEEEEEDEKERL